MATVFLARDLKHDRPVALKVLHPELASTLGPERFTREIEIAAGLSHPHILPLFDSGVAGGLLYYVMPYVQGESLRQRLDRLHHLPLDEALELAMHVADALAYAHHHHVVHRDIKPENILVQDRHALVTDFGVARALVEAGGGRLTGTGVAVGTPLYMSPEQAAGAPADYRSDLFSLGLVLYESVTGTHPFPAGLIAILADEAPAPSRIAPHVPPQLDPVLEKALEKDAEYRYQHAEELLTDLKRVRRELGRGGGASPAGPRPPRRGRLEFQVLRLTSVPGIADGPTFSPDGQSVAYASDESGFLNVYLKQIAGGKAIRLTPGAADDALPAWSPDGSRIAFVSARDHGGRLSLMLGVWIMEFFLIGKNGDLFVTPAFGGPVRKLADNAYYPCWTPDGHAIVYQSSRGGQWDLWRVPADGGEPERLTDTPLVEYQPDISPDGDWLAYGVGDLRTQQYHIHARRLGDQRVVVITDDASVALSPAWSADGRVLYFCSNRGGAPTAFNVWRVPFALEEGRVLGPPERVTAGTSSYVNLAVSRDGAKIAYADLRIGPDICSVDPAAGTVTRWTTEQTFDDAPHLSPDSKVLAFTSDRSGAFDIWTLEREGGVLTQLTSGKGQAYFPRWSPDGRRLAYTVATKFEEGSEVWVMDADGSHPQRVVPGVDFKAEPVWSPDGRHLAYVANGQVWIAPPAGGEPRALTSHPPRQASPDWSPDGRRIAFQSPHAEHREIWIAETASGNSRRLTAGPDEDSHPSWAWEGDRLYFGRNHKNLMGLDLEHGTPRQLTAYEKSNLVLDFPKAARDGSVFFSLSEGHGDIYVLRLVEGEQPRPAR